MTDQWFRHSVASLISQAAVTMNWSSSCQLQIRAFCMFFLLHQLQCQSLSFPKSIIYMERFLISFSCSPACRLFYKFTHLPSFVHYMFLSEFCACLLTQTPGILPCDVIFRQLHLVKLLVFPLIGRFPSSPMILETKFLEYLSISSCFFLILHLSKSSASANLL